MKKSIGLCTSLFVVACLSSAEAANISYFSNQTEWEVFTRAQSNQGFVRETFSGRQLNQSSLSFNSAGDGGVIGSNNAGFDAFYAIPTTTGGYTTWSFAESITYFGADFNLAIPGGPGSGLQIVLDWDEATGGGIRLQQIDRMTGGSTYHSLQFWGIFSDTPFQTLTILSGTQNGDAEAYYMDNMVYQNPVPEPASMLLLGVGAGLLAITRRKKK